MAILNKTQILDYIKRNDIQFTPPLDGFQLQPNSVDLRIGWSFYIPEHWHLTDEGRAAIRPDYLSSGFNKDYFKLLKLKPGQYFEILPGEFVFISTLEKVDLRSGNLMAILYPRSSMIRRGFVIQSGVVDVNYSGHLVISLLNNTTQYLKLYPGERVCQLIFHTLTSELSPGEARKHGLSAGKYVGSTPYNLEARTDSDQEIKFIREGNIEGLKKNFPLDEYGKKKK
ncbi:MAG: dCTP deaminase [Candidatus Portnoybacteria bacterium]|nr:dCTP deaminase [Candidatus Portnoybacteria bacterium]